MAFNVALECVAPSIEIEKKTLQHMLVWVFYLVQVLALLGQEMELALEKQLDPEM